MSNFFERCLLKRFGDNGGLDFSEILQCPLKKWPDGDAGAGLTSAVAWLIKRSAWSLAHDIADGTNLCESPIEAAFLLALRIVVEEFPWDFAIKGSNHEERAQVVVWPQAKIGKYRVDFHVAFRSELPRLKPSHTGDEADAYEWRLHEAALLVECDGHDFHEKSKEQAQRDKSRDRELAKCGFNVFRYTGSEIWRDPIKCGQEVFDYISNDDRKGTDATP